MTTTQKMIVVLTVITMLAGAVLSTWDGYTRPKIEAHRLAALKAAISEVLPPYQEYEEISADGITLYVGKDESNQPIAIACEAVGSGFQGKISIMVGLTMDFKQITGIKILEQIETPGLGTKIVVDPTNKQDPYWFSNQFKQLHTEPAIGVVKNVKPTKPHDIQAITGATISSQAVVKILNDFIIKVREAYTSIQSGQAKEVSQIN
jgi:Na+-translocating ferredoxin:NAD+ oxidoreductase subunit G